MLKTIMVTTALLALAACGSGDTKDRGNPSAAATGNVAAAPAGSGVQLQPGQWETTTKFVKIEGMPKEMAGMMAQPTTGKNCITPDDIKEANAGIFGGEEQKNCKQEGFAFKNGRVTGKLSCTGEQGQGSSTFEMNGQYTATTYDVTSRISTDVNNMKMTMESRTEGRRVGECPAGEAKEG